MSYFVDQDAILFRKTLKGSFVFYLFIGVGVALVQLPLPEQPDIRDISDRVAKLILETPKFTPPPKVVPPPQVQVSPKEVPKKTVVKAAPKPVRSARKKAQKNIPKKKPVEPDASLKPSAEQSREIVRKSGLLASLIAEEEGGALGEIMEDMQLDEVLSSVNVISSPRKSKKISSRLRVMSSPASNPLIDKKIAGLGKANKKKGTQLAKREPVTLTQIGAEHGGMDGNGHGIGRGIGLQLKGSGSGNAAIDYDAIARVVDKYKGGLVYLYNKELRANPTLKGTVTVEFSINEIGKVIDAHITSSTMDHAKLEKALARRIKMWKFPKLYQGVIIVTYPFVFFPV